MYISLWRKDIFCLFFMRYDDGFLPFLRSMWIRLLLGVRWTRVIVLFLTEWVKLLVLILILSKIYRYVLSIIEIHVVFLLRIYIQ